MSNPAMPRSVIIVSHQQFFFNFSVNLSKHLLCVALALNLPYLYEINLIISMCGRQHYKFWHGYHGLRKLHRDWTPATFFLLFLRLWCFVALEGRFPVFWREYRYCLCVLCWRNATLLETAFRTEFQSRFCVLTAEGRSTKLLISRPLFLQNFQALLLINIFATALSNKKSHLSHKNFIFLFISSKWTNLLENALR